MNKRILKAYERYDYNGRVVPGSLVLRDRKPKNGKWKELTGYECCNDIIPYEYFRMSVSTLLPDSSFDFFVQVNTGPMNFSINWGDGSPLEPVNIGYNAVLTHTFSAPNDYQIELIFSDGSNVNIDTFTISNNANLTGIPDLSLLSNARVLEFTSCTNLDILEILAMPNLINLVLTNCTNLSINLFGTLPVGSLPVLSSIACQNTAISNINVLAAPDLYVLYSSGTQIGDPTNIDNIFINILANDRTGGAIDVSGGTNAAPTAASAAARATLTNFDYDYYLAYN
jgi:hypothetical protein